MDHKELDLSTLKLIGITGGIWRVPSVAAQPVALLESWQVYELDNGERHLVGWCSTACEGRVTSAVQTFDAGRRQMRTRSGRLYELRGPSGSNGDAHYVWEGWCEANGVQGCRTVTEDVERELEAAASGC